MNSKLSRRAFLRGAGGAIIGLPLLEITHGKAWASAGTAKRFIVVYREGGTVNNIDRYAINTAGWRHDGSDANQGNNLWTSLNSKTTAGTPTVSALKGNLGRIQSILAGHESKLTLLTGIDNQAGILNTYYLGDHVWNTLSCLTCNTNSQTDPSVKPVAQGPSIDQLLAQRLSAQNPSPFSSVNLGVYWDFDSTPPFFSGAGAAVESETDPQKAFATYLGGVSAGAPDPTVVKQRAMGQSVLDGASTGYKAIESKLSMQDRQVVDAHLTHISELEQSIKALATATCTPPSVDKTVQATDLQHTGTIMADIIVAAMRCGLTQVATLNLGNVATGWLPEPYMSIDSDHTLHHCASALGQSSSLSNWMTQMVNSRQWCLGLYQRILEALDSTPEGSGTMLDNTVLLYTSNFSNGSLHSANDVPILLAGSAGGYLKTGNHVEYNIANTASSAYAYQTKTGTHNLYTTLLNAFGFSDAHFGISSGMRGGVSFKGPLPEIVA